MVYTLLPVFSIGCILCFVNDLLDNLLLLMPSASNNRFTKLFSSVTHVPFLRGSAQAHIDLFLFGFILYAPVSACMNAVGIISKHFQKHFNSGFQIGT